MPAETKNPLASGAGGLFSILLWFWPFSSGHSSPPAWSSHDDGDDDDGGGTASEIEIMKAGLVCQMPKCEFSQNRHWPQRGRMKQNLGMGSRIAAAVWSIMLAFAFVASAASQASQRSVELVDINRATVAELVKVPGMTASWAARIVRFRPYRTKLDLADQGVVTPEVYQRIRDGVIAHRVASDGQTKY